MKTLSELRAEADRFEQRAHQLLGEYIRGNRSWDDLERVEVEAYCAQRRLSDAEALDFLRRTTDNETVAKLARACGVNLGPDLRPDNAISRSTECQSKLPMILHSEK